MKEQDQRLQEQLQLMRLHYLREQYLTVATEAAQKHWTHIDYLARLIDGEAQVRHQRAVQRRIAAARFPTLKLLEDFQWSWPKKINRAQVQNLFRLAFVPEALNLHRRHAGGVTLGTDNRPHMAEIERVQDGIRARALLKPQTQAAIEAYRTFLLGYFGLDREPASA